MLIRVEWMYHLPKTKKAYFMKSEFMRVEDCMAFVADLEKTGRLKGEIVFLDQQDSTWTKKELVRYMKRFETEPHDIIAYIDGGYDRSSNKAGIGVVLYYKQHGKDWRIRFNDRLDLLEDNNEAEYAALHRLLQQLQITGIKHQEITVHLDSLVVRNQAAGEWPCLEKHYVSWLDRIDELVKELRLTIHYEQIDRHANKEADQLASQALKGVFVESKVEKSQT